MSRALESLRRLVAAFVEFFTSRPTDALGAKPMHLPLTDETRDVIRREVSDSIARDGRSWRARNIQVWHQCGGDVRKMTVDALIGTNIVEVGGQS